MEFIFKLGFSGQLAEAELASILGFQPKKISDHEFLVQLPNLPALNAAANRAGGLIEVVFSDTKKVVWRHSAKYWQKVDRRKPYLDIHKGLMPPKIARQMVNLAIGKDLDTGKTLFDPFCGSGTILLEASHLGLPVIGSDLDSAQLSGVEENLKWAKANYRIFKSDAAEVSQHLKQPVDYIVTEPFMGKLRYRTEDTENIARGLEKLYLGALKEWSKILVKGGKVVMIFPIFPGSKHDIITGDIVDHSALSGYNVLTRGIIYSQPKAAIKREIIVLEKK